MSLFLKLAVTALLVWVALIPAAFASVDVADGRYFKTVMWIWMGTLAAAALLAGCELLAWVWSQ